MSAQIVKGQSTKELAEFMSAACYSGERFIVKGERGILVAIVPFEDLELLQELDGISLGCLN